MASSLIEAPNLDNKPKEKDLVAIFKNKKRYKKAKHHHVKAHKEGYSQHMIAKVLGMAQSMINGIVKRYS